MSEEHVTAVFGPPHVRQAVDFYRRRYYAAADVIVHYRRMLHERDATLPDSPYDGDAWAKYEPEPRNE